MMMSKNALVQSSALILESAQAVCTVRAVILEAPKARPKFVTAAEAPTGF